MSDAVGTDNPAFANEDDRVSGSKLENDGQQQANLDQERKFWADGAPIENGHQRSYISQHYVEPIKPSTEQCYKTETRIELPADNNTDKSTAEPKLNGVHGNGNNNDASFLNNSATNVQVNDSGKKEQIEAVNLELVSMRPYTGSNIQTKGQEACEVPADPYEEYFVPVNEHRKYIRGPEAEVETTVAGVRFDLGPGVGREGLSLRDPAAGLVDYSHWLTALRGEKLYVTKDKRSRSSYWRRLACWGCGALVLVIAVIIAILAATGVILAQEATEPLENAEESNSHKFNDVQIAGRQEYVKDPPISPPPLTSSFPPWPTTDETLYGIVPDALDGILRLDDFDWNEDLSDTKSRIYRQVTSEIEEHLKNMFQSTDEVSVIKVYDINKEGEVKFRISHPSSSVPEKTQESIEEALRKNSNMIGRYHLNRLQVRKLIDQCEYGNLECSESCRYDYPAGTFVCVCSSGKMLDQDGKTCVDDSDLSNIEIEDVITQSNTESIHDFVQGRSRGPGTIQFEPRRPDTLENPDVMTVKTDTSTSEPKIEDVHTQSDRKSPIEETQSTSTTERIHKDDNFHWYHGQPNHSTETKSETDSFIKLSPAAGSTVQPFIVPTELESVSESEPTAEPEPTAESEPVPEVNPAAEPKPTAEAEPVTEAEPVAEPEPATEAAPVAEPEPIAGAEPAAKPEPATEAEPVAEPTPATKVESAAKPEPVTEAEPTAEPEPVIETESKSVIVPEPAIELKLATEPNTATESVLSVATVKPDIELKSTAVSQSSAESDSTTELQFTVESVPTSERVSPGSKTSVEPESAVGQESPTKSEVLFEVGSTIGTEYVTETGPTVETQYVPTEHDFSINSASEAVISHTAGSHINNDGRSETELHRFMTTQSYLESNPELYDQSESTAKLMPRDDLSAETTTQISFLNKSIAINLPKSLTDITDKNEDFKENVSPIGIEKPGIDSIDNGPSLLVIPLISKNETMHITDSIKTKTETTTIQSYISKEDKIGESVTSEAGFTTVNYENLKRDNDENTSIISQNDKESNLDTKQFTQDPSFQEDKEEVESTTKSKFDININHVQRPSTDERNLMTEQQSSTISDTSKQLSSTTMTTVLMSEVPVEDRTESITRSTTNGKHFHTIEINGISSTNAETYNNPKISETISSTNVFTQPLPAHDEEHVSQSVLQPESTIHDSNEKNVIEHMPTTVFPKAPKNIAHNVEPLVEAITKSTDEEHIMLISKSEEPVEIHAIIPQLTPEQSVQPTNETLKTENSFVQINNGIVINENVNAKKTAENVSFIGSSTVRTTNENIVHMDNNGYAVRPDEVQEHSTNHPLHPAILPENAVEHSAGKLDANDDRHVEDMSPFLPDVQREKESSKKAPRLDKDEQDAPNPFETHIEDVIIHRPLIHNNAAGIQHRVNETETRDLLNDLNSHSASDKKKISITKKITESHKTNAVNDIGNDTKDNIKNDSGSVAEIINDTESKSQHVLGQDDRNLGDNSQRFPHLHNIDTMGDTEDKKDNSSPEENNEAFKVIPLMIKDKPTDSISQTTIELTERTNKTSEVPTISTQKNVKEEITDFVAGRDTINSGKAEENAVEDQYNDITDERLSKGYRHGNAGNNIPVKVAEQSRKELLSNADSVENPYENKSPLVPVLNVTKETNSTDEKTFSDTEQNPMTTTESVLGDQTDARLTTQEPVLPMEIQQEMLTTIGTDKVDTVTIINDDKSDEKNTKQLNVTRFDEKEVITAQITTRPAESNTTAQVPILPEELQTTESDIMITTTMKSNEMKPLTKTVVDKAQQEILTENANNERRENGEDKIENAVTHSIETDKNSTSSEEIMVTTTPYEDNASMKSNERMRHDEHINEQSETTTENSTESTKIETTLTISTTDSDNVERTSTLPNDITTMEDVRPVTEVLLDDTQPMIEFDYRTLFPTTTPKPMVIKSNSDELSDEELRVIPLEKSQEGKKKSADKKGFDKYKYKKDKDISLENQDEENILTKSSFATVLSQTEQPKLTIDSDEEFTDSAVSSDLNPNVPKFIVVDREGNVLPTSKLRTMEAIDRNNNTKNKVVPEMKSKNYPSFIPVSEEIMETIPITKPYMVMRNYTYSPLFTFGFGTESTTMNESANEGRITSDLKLDLSNNDARMNETGRRPATFSEDQLFNDPVDANIDRITKESTMPQSTMRTTSLNISVENTTVISSPSRAAPNAIFSKCTTGQFQCKNGTTRDGAYCIALSAQCDSENDCSDSSDELNCEEEGCPGNFQCANGQCLKRHLVCNKIADCDDGSDEHNCGDWKCQFDEFRCPSGRCIPALWQCDGRPDCEGHRDEYNCAESCGNNEYLCPTEKWCIPQSWHCNGIPECINGEDEKLCDCAMDQFKCESGGCIPSMQRCDGIENCPDRSDEWSCLITNITAEKNATDVLTDSTTGNDTTNDLTGRVSSLKIRQHDGDYRLVCSDGWSKEFSDSYCRALGFAGAETTETSIWDKNQKILRLRTNPNHRMPLVTNLEQVEFCVSGKVVQISCQEFSCDFNYAEGPTARLAGGTPVSDGQWSSVALLKDLKHGVACTASILGPMHALAGYSCIYRHKEKSGWQLFTGGNMLMGHPIKNIVPYPQVKYNQFLYNNDIALIELEEPLIFSRNISPVCLPRQPIQARQICVTAGWGFSMNGEIDLQQYLKFLPIPAYESDKCNATSHYAGFITEHDICAGFTDKNKGPCYNDEGAPLMCLSESQGATEQWEIYGLLSHHSRCSRGHPAIYSSVEPALSWLRESVPALRTQS